jgi:ADP-ribose pyrophosphatase
MTILYTLEAVSYHRRKTRQKQGRAYAKIDSHKRQSFKKEAVMSPLPIPPNSKTDSNLEEKPLSSETVFCGVIATVRVDQALHPSGATVRREVVQHPGGVVVCSILEDGRIIFVRQWRYPLGQTLLELPAGKLDWHEGIPENPADAIKRELREETGYEANDWESKGTLFTAPGFCDEKLWLYQARNLKQVKSGVNLPNREAGEQTQQPSELEWLDLVFLHPYEAFAMISRGEITDAKTVALLSLCFFQPSF